MGFGRYGTYHSINTHSVAHKETLVWNPQYLTDTETEAYLDAVSERVPQHMFAQDKALELLQSCRYDIDTALSVLHTILTLGSLHHMDFTDLVDIIQESSE